MKTRRYSPVDCILGSTIAKCRMLLFARDNSELSSQLITSIVIPISSACTQTCMKGCNHKEPCGHMNIFHKYLLNVSHLRSLYDIENKTTVSHVAENTIISAASNSIHCIHYIELFVHTSVNVPPSSNTIAHSFVYGRFICLGTMKHHVVVQ